MLPSVDELLDGSTGFSIPLVSRFRRTEVREGLLIRGPAGWGEFAPFPEYSSGLSARWLAAAVEAAWIGWPTPVRDSVPVNAIVPAVDAATAGRLARESGCSTVKVKVADPEQALSDGPNSWPLGRMRELLETLMELDRVVKTHGFPEDRL